MKLNDQRGAGITDRAVKAQRELSCIYTGILITISIILLNR